MEILKIDLARLANHPHFQLMTEVKELIEKTGAKALKIEPQFNNFVLKYADEDVAIEKIRKSMYSDAKKSADKDRDKTFRGIVDYVSSSINHFNPEIQEAAKRIKIILNQFGNLAAVGVKDQTSKTYNLLQELTAGERKDDAEAIGLLPWLTQLESQNTAVKEIENKQYDESVAKTDIKVRDARNEVDAIYRDMVKRIEALALIEGEEAYGAYIRQLNERVMKYRNLIAQKSAKPEDAPAAPQSPTDEATAQ